MPATCFNHFLKVLLDLVFIFFKELFSSCYMHEADLAFLRGLPWKVHILVLGYIYILGKKVSVKLDF